MVHRGFAVFVGALCLTAQTPTFRLDTRLVEVNVIVRDQNNKPIQGLTKDDFALFDRNKEQKIAFFSTASVHRLEKPEQTASAGTYTNRPEQQSEAPTSIT